MSRMAYLRPKIVVSTISYNVHDRHCIVCLLVIQISAALKNQITCEEKPLKYAKVY